MPTQSKGGGGFGAALQAVGSKAKKKKKTLIEKIKGASRGPGIPKIEGLESAIDADSRRAESARRAQSGLR